MIHRYAAFVAFCLMAGLGIAFGRWLRRREPDRARRANTVVACGWCSFTALAFTSAPYVLEWFGIGRPQWLEMAGLLQRLTIASGIVALLAIGGYLNDRTATADEPAEPFGPELHLDAPRSAAPAATQYPRAVVNRPNGNALPNPAAGASGTTLLRAAAAE